MESTIHLIREGSKNSCSCTHTLHNVPNRETISAAKAHPEVRPFTLYRISCGYPNISHSSSVRRIFVIDFALPVASSISATTA